MQMLERAREAGAAAVHISGIGNGGDVETVAPEASYAYTASHTGALLRLAQIATALGAQLGDARRDPGPGRRRPRAARAADRVPSASSS